MSLIFGYRFFRGDEGVYYSEIKGMKKKMGCKVPVEAKYRSNLMVVRILARRATPQTAFYSPRHLFAPLI